MFGCPEHSRKDEEYLNFFFLVGPLFGPQMGLNLAGFNGARMGRVQASGKKPV